MEDKNTRMIILNEALSLFASRGYADVSMRDIAAACNIQASSIYHHFSGKQQIFDALVEQVKAMKDNLQMMFMQAFSQNGKTSKKTTEKDFVMVGMAFVSEFLNNPQVGPLLKVVECERLHNEGAEYAWKELMIDAPLEHETMIFKALMDRKEIMEDDPRALAEEYQSMIFVAYFSGDMDRLKTQLTRFYRRIFVSAKNKKG